MYHAGVTDKYKKIQGKTISGPDDVRREGTLDIIKIAEGIGNISDPEKKFDSAVDFLKGKKYNVIYNDYVRQVGRKLVTEDYYTKGVQKIAKHIHNHLDERLEQGKKGLSNSIAEHYALRLGALVTEAFNRSLKGDIDDPYMRMINYQHIEQLLKSTPVRGEEGKQVPLWDIVVQQIKKGEVHDAYSMLIKVMSEGLKSNLEQTIETKLDLKDYDFRAKAGEILSEKSNEHLEDVDKFVAEGFLQEAADTLVKSYADGGIEAVVKDLEKAGKVESKPQEKKDLPFKSKEIDKYEYDKAA